MQEGIDKISRGVNILATDLDLELKLDEIHFLSFATIRCASSSGMS
jgi:hypothetical protein